MKKIYLWIALIVAILAVAVFILADDIPRLFKPATLGVGLTYDSNHALPGVYCRFGGGKLKAYGSSGADSCDYFRGSAVSFMPAFGCDCGPEKCWENGKCVENPKK